MKEALLLMILLTLSCGACVADEGDFTYLIDDGSAGFALGVGPNLFTVRANNFTVEEGFNTITCVQALWFLNTGSTQVTAAVWSDPNQDGEPLDAELLAVSAPTTAVGTNVFQNFDLLEPVNVGPDGTSFFIGLFWGSGAATDLFLGVDLSNTFDISWTLNGASVQIDNLSEALNTPNSSLMIRAAAAATSPLLGDINCDGVVDLLDVQPFVDLISNGVFSEKGDFDQDGMVTLLDVGPFVDALANSGG